MEDIIRQFRGLPRSVMDRSPKRMPKAFGSALDRSLLSYKIDLNLSDRTDIGSIQSRIIKNWRNIVGGACAHRSQPREILQGHTLVITTHNSTLRSEMLFSRRKILENVRNCVGPEIQSVVIR